MTVIQSEEAEKLVLKKLLEQGQELLHVAAIVRGSSRGAANQLQISL